MESTLLIVGRGYIGQLLLGAFDHPRSELISSRELLTRVKELNSSRECFSVVWASGSANSQLQGLAGVSADLNMFCAAMQVIGHPDVIPRLRRFVLVSSCGNLAPLKGTSLVTEQDFLRPSDSYNTLNFQREAAIPPSLENVSVILRVSNPFGDLYNVFKRGFFYHLSRSVVSGDDFHFFGTAGTIRNFIHEVHVAKSIEALLNSSATGVFNVASGHNINIRALLVTLSNKFDFKLVEAPARVNDVINASISNKKFVSFVPECSVFEIDPSVWIINHFFQAGDHGNNSNNRG